VSKHHDGQLAAMTPAAPALTMDELAAWKPFLYGGNWTMRSDAVEAVYGHIAAQSREIESLQRVVKDWYAKVEARDEENEALRRKVEAADRLAEQASVHVEMYHDPVQCDALKVALTAYRGTT